MKVTVNGKEKVLKDGSSLKDAVKGENYVEGSLISIYLSTERMTQTTNDFSIVTDRGEMVLHLYDTPEAQLFKDNVNGIAGSNTRWANKELVAFGSFPTEIVHDATEGTYKKFECFFSLGGNDNQTTYLMVARSNFSKAYGAGAGKIGKITVGRHLLDVLREGETLQEIKPVVSETSKDNVTVTSDLAHPLEDGCVISTEVLVKLDSNSPGAAEHLLVVSAKGYLNVSEGTGTFLGCRDDLDVDLKAEDTGVRDIGNVMVRTEGSGQGHIMIYKERRPAAPGLSTAGTVERGRSLVTLATPGDKVTVSTDPPRLLSVGMTQAQGEKFLSRFGIKQIRKGESSDDAVIVDQGPESTMEAIRRGEVETFGVPKDQIYRIAIKTTDESTIHYFKKVTGLSHKPIGQLKTQFSFPGSPMVTFYGDDARSQNLYPQDPFKKCKKGEIGVTNQSRPHHGLIGIRLIDSKQYGPTGEEAYGTNLVGTFLGDLSQMEVLEDEQIIYITEEKL